MNQSSQQRPTLRVATLDLKVKVNHVKDNAIATGTTTVDVAGITITTITTTSAVGITTVVRKADQTTVVKAIADKRVKVGRIIVVDLRTLMVTDKTSTDLAITTVATTTVTITIVRAIVRNIAMPIVISVMAVQIQTIAIRSVSSRSMINNHHSSIRRTRQTKTPIMTSPTTVVRILAIAKERTTHALIKSQNRDSYGNRGGFNRGGRGNNRGNFNRGNAAPVDGNRRSDNPVYSHLNDSPPKRRKW